MYRFHITVHAAPSDLEPATRPAASTAAALPVTFEEAADVLQALPRLFFEPDGSFVWASTDGTTAWQVDGNLYDRGDRLAYAELKGLCPPTAFDALLRAFGWPATSLVFQLMREAVFFDEAAFRRVAVAS